MYICGIGRQRSSKSNRSNIEDFTYTGLLVTPWHILLYTDQVANGAQDLNIIKVYVNTNGMLVIQFDNLDNLQVPR